MHDCKLYIYILNSETKNSLHNEVSISQECDANVVAQHDQVSATRSRCTLFTALVPGPQHQHTVVRSTLNKLTQRVPTHHIDPIKMLVGCTASQIIRCQPCMTFVGPFSIGNTRLRTCFARSGLSTALLMRTGTCSKDSVMCTSWYSASCAIPLSLREVLNKPLSSRKFRLLRMGSKSSSGRS
jgi:hypothetical protein